MAKRDHKAAHARERRLLEWALRPGVQRRFPEIGLTDEDLARFDALRTWRRSAAKRAGVPPYEVFLDKTLAAIAHHLPMSLEELSAIDGVTAAKVEAYGLAVLRVLVGVRAFGPKYRGDRDSSALLIADLADERDSYRVMCAELQSILDDAKREGRLTDKAELGCSFDPADFGFD